MKRFVLGLAATVATIALAPAANATICIGVAVNGGAISNVACDAGTGSVNYNTTTGGYFYNVGATGNPLLSMATLLTQSINIQSQGGANALIDVYVTQQGITSPSTGLLSTLTSNTISGATATLTSYYSAANALFSGTQLQQGVFTGPGVLSAGNAIAVANPWSETVKYSLNFTGGNGSNFNGTANLTAVPEPATWGLMLLGFGAMGGMLRTRARKVRVRFA
jgi:hypothetical protein